MSTDATMPFTLLLTGFLVIAVFLILGRFYLWAVKRLYPERFMTPEQFPGPWSMLRMINVNFVIMSNPNGDTMLIKGDKIFWVINHKDRKIIHDPYKQLTDVTEERWQRLTSYIEHGRAIE